MAARLPAEPSASTGAVLRLRWQATAGWLVLLTLEVFAPLDWDDDGLIARALMLAILVTVPLGLAFAAVPDRRGPGHEPWPLRAISLLQAPAAALAVVALLLPQGWMAGALTLPWLVLAALAALWAAGRFLQRPWPLAEEVAVDAGLAFLLNGAFWLAAWRAGLGFGFGDLVVALTAIHFHFASFAIPLMLGAGGRALRHGRSRPFALATAAILVGLPATAAGIVSWPPLEVAGAILVAAGGLAAAVLALRGAAGAGGAARFLLAVAGLAAFGGMALAAAYGLRIVEPDLMPPWRVMVLVHSGLNALGFTLCGLLGWTFVGPLARAAPPGLPFSRLRSTGPVGADFLERTGAVDAMQAAPRGLTPDLGAFRGHRFHPDSVDPALRAFYEETLAFDLKVTPEWPPGIRSAAAKRLWGALARRFQQNEFPVAGEEGLRSRLVAVRSDVDGRGDVRGWVRTRPDGRAMYVAAYSTHVLRGERYANIAFPWPGGNLTSVLRWEDEAERPGGLRLTTHPGDEPGDQGVYFANRWLPLRLPINETIFVWVEGGLARARHDIRVLGFPFLTLHYRMDRQPGREPRA